MAHKPQMTLRKQAKQPRGIATVEAIVEAATYILARRGPGAFTTNRVAERAGVNIASLYQYFPNKEALLFHIVKVTWERQLARLAPVLARPGGDHARKLRDFLREFFLIEAAEADLRGALRIAAVDLKDTDEFRAVISRGGELTRAFLRDALGSRTPDDLDFHVNFIVVLTTSFAERTTDERASEADLVRQADLIADMLIEHYGIAEASSSSN